MTKIKMLRIVNALMLLAILTVVVSMGLYKFGPSALQGTEILGELHGLAGLCFVILAIIHLSLNWGWMKMNYFAQKKK